MQLSLAQKISGSYALLVVLVLAMLAVQAWFEDHLAQLKHQEEQLRLIALQVRGISARVQSGVLTRDESFAIAAAREAQIAERAFADLGPSQAALRSRFRQYFAALVAINSMYLENRTEEGARRLNELQEEEQAIDRVVAEVASSMRVESVRLGKQLRLFQISVIVGILLLLVIVSWLLRRQVTQPIEHAVEVAGAIAEGRFDNVIGTSKQRELRRLLGALETMQKRLKADIEHERTLRRETQRIKEGLYSSTAAITIADANGFLLEATPSAQSLLEQLSHQSFKQLLGKRLTETVLTDPSHQTMLADAVQRHQDIDITLGKFNLRLSARPILDEAGQSIGQVSAWLDRTQEVRAETELKTLLAAALHGDFSKRIPSEGKQGFFYDMAVGMNQLIDSVAKALDDLASVLEALANRDLSRKIDTDYAGTLGRLKDDANATVEQLRTVVGQIKAASEAINVAAKEIAAGNADLAQRTAQEAFNLEKTTSSMEKVSNVAKNNAERAHQAVELANQANTAAEQGGEMVKRLVETIGEIQASSHKIGDIIGVINSIAFQTNILALNAAVEAARAGEQGRGFAVVAGEVRQLAQRSGEAAKEIKQLIEESLLGVEKGVSLAKETGDSIEGTVEGFQRLKALVEGIAEASREQAIGIDQISQALAAIEETTQQNAALVEQAAAAAESLEKQAQGLDEMVAVFRLGATLA